MNGKWKFLYGKWRGVLFFILLGIFLVGLSQLPDKYLPPRPTATPTLRPADTPLPTSTNTYLLAHTNIDTPCLSGTNEEDEMITTIPQGKDVMLMGKDGEQAQWILVRLFSVPDCWVERRFVTSADVDKVNIVPTPAPLTSTPSSTATPDPTQTVDPTKTKTRVPLTPTPTRRSPNDTNTPRPQTNTPQSHSDTPSEPSKTPEPTDTPRPPTATPCPTNPVGQQPPGLCR